ncbi:MAG TPA: hypothetical protein DCP69_09065 [Candidatus Omnitrophica bacterium]|nr:hypothetical protein [Candidatus Omnitrophota bacterium]
MGVACSVEEKVRRCVARHPEWDDNRISSAATAPVRLVRAARAKQGKGSAHQEPAAKQRGKTLQQFRAQFDVRERIRVGLKTHLNGVYMTDQEFREACGIPAQDWRRFADLEEFELYRWRHKTIVYWAQPKMLATMRETVGAV